MGHWICALNNLALSTRFAAWPTEAVEAVEAGVCGCVGSRVAAEVRGSLWKRWKLKKENCGRSSHTPLHKEIDGIIYR